MKYLKFTKALAVIAVFSLFLSGCDKMDQVDPIGDRGQTIVKLVGGGTPGETTFAIDFVPTPTRLLVVDVRRDVPNNSELNKSATVTLTLDTSVVSAAGYTVMNPAWYTLSGEGVVVNGNTIVVTFAPGEFAKEIYITVPDATVLDPSSAYGIGFKITSSSQGVVTKNNTLIAVIGAKNQYDGRYQLTFSNYHPSSNPGYTGGVTEVEMWTTSGNCVKIFWPDAGGFANPAVLGGNLTYFGAQEPQYCVDPVTNKVTVTNAFAGAVTFYTMNPTFNSHYDPATKTFYVRWGYSYVGGNFAPGASREWTQTFKYLGPR